MRSEKFIRSKIRNILLEEEAAETPQEQPKKKGKIKRGTVGRGRVKDKVKEAKALASKNPKKLMKNLNIKSIGGTETPEKILNLVRAAIYGTETMASAYSGAVMKQDSESGLPYIKVAAGSLGVRDGAMYMLHTITGADNAGIIGNIDYDIEVAVKNGQIMIEFLS